MLPELSSPYSHITEFQQLIFTTLQPASIKGLVEMFPKDMWDEHFPTSLLLEYSKTALNALMVIINASLSTCIFLSISYCEKQPLIWMTWKKYFLVSNVCITYIKKEKLPCLSISGNHNNLFRSSQSVYLPTPTS